MGKFDSKALLASYIKQKLGEHGGSRRSWALSKKLQIKAVERAEKAENAVTLDTLDEIAEACVTEPWKLLHPSNKIPDAVVIADPEVRHLAAVIDEIVMSDPDPKRRLWAMQLLNLATTSPPPGQVGILEVVTGLAKALQAT